MTGIASAQEATPAAAMPAGVPTVSVNGHGEVNVPPDTATVTIGIDVIQPTLEAAQDEATAQATAITEALQAAGIPDEDLQTAYFSVSILRDFSENGDPTQITGYQVTNQLNVTVRDVDALGELLETAVAAGANNIWGINFYLEDQTAAQSEARTEAVANAREKAEQLAAAAELTLGPVVAIAEGVAPIVSPVYAMGRGGGMDMAQSAAVPVEPGSTTVAVDVTMTFELR